MADDNRTREEAATIAVENPAPETSLAEVADQLRVPEGYRVEILGGQVVVSPTPCGATHESSPISFTHRS